MKYITDGKRHLICVPYSVANLHKMADDLKLKRHWFHGGAYPHYDIPKKRQTEIETICQRVPSKQLLQIIKGTYHGNF